MFGEIQKNLETISPESHERKRAWCPSRKSEGQWASSSRKRRSVTAPGLLVHAGATAGWGQPCPERSGHFWQLSDQRGQLHHLLERHLPGRWVKELVVYSEGDHSNIPKRLDSIWLLAWNSIEIILREGILSCVKAMNCSILVAFPEAVPWSKHIWCFCKSALQWGIKYLFSPK